MKRFFLLSLLALPACSHPKPPPEPAPMPAAAAGMTLPRIDRETAAAFETATFALG